MKTTLMINPYSLGIDKKRKLLSKTIHLQVMKIHRQRKKLLRSYRKKNPK